MGSSLFYGVFLPVYILYFGKDVTVIKVGVFVFLGGKLCLILMK